MEPPRPSPRPGLSALDGAAIVVGIVIGVGLFRSPPVVAANVPNEAAYVAVWAAGGLVAIIGGLCYAELGSAFPSAGGEYRYLQRAFGRPLAVLFAWARGAVIQTGAIAVVAFAYADYAQQLLPLGQRGPAIHAALAVAALTGLNLVGRGGTVGIQRLLSMALVFALVVLAPIVAAGVEFGVLPAPPASPPSEASGGALGLAMVFVLLTYGGWNEAAYLGEDLRDPGRDTVRVIIFGLGAVAAIYLIVNLAFLAVLGLDGLRAADAVGADLMRASVGEGGAWGLSLAVCVAALSTLNATIFTGARTSYALGRDVRILSWLGGWRAGGENPAPALLLQAAVSLGLIAFGATTRDGFQAMVDYTAPTFWFFMLLVGLSVMRLRRTEPNAPRPFRTPLYPATPILFCATSAYLLYSSIAYTGMGALLGVAVLLAGGPLVWAVLRDEADHNRKAPAQGE
ncbi:APC family permease [Phenylobacterium sp.]|uniref:APC family permease n=1 Tax=Phenylobacterium sp. TaxID=1871053 RepID=UPI002E37AD87|nr:APC family permease [Phenylobacterium sp.]HEX2560407.1 APC family permease [Phenylobacterium sp.]